MSQVLAGCCAVLWLTGLVSVGQGNLMLHWTAPHCPQGHAQNSQHSHNHCAWHCGGVDIQNGGEHGETTADLHVSLVWSLGALPVQDAVAKGQFPPRGPPQRVLGVS